MYLLKAWMMVPLFVMSWSANLIQLYAEGVLYAKKDYNLAKHPKVDVPNLEVIKLMQSFKSKEYVRETFSWQHYYWYLTNDGIEHLRSYLNLPSEVVPNTLKKSAKPPSRPFGSGPPGDRPRWAFIPFGFIICICEYGNWMLLLWWIFFRWWSCFQICKLCSDHVKIVEWTSD